MNQLRLENCHVVFKDNHIINDISFTICSNKITAILGPNGTGKSTLFKTIIGQCKLTKGKILLNNVDISSHKLNARIELGIGYLPQLPSIFRQLTVLENLEIVKQRLPSANLENIIHDFKISSILNKLGSNLSGGQRRIVEIARCIAMQPKFILLDEPYAGIDPKTIHLINSILIKIREKNIGIIISDHQAEKTINIADHTIILCAGKLLAEGNAEEILSDKEVLKHYLGEVLE